jgi:hypothetical protein
MRGGVGEAAQQIDPGLGGELAGRRCRAHDVEERARNPAPGEMAHHVRRGGGDEWREPPGQSTEPQRCLEHGRGHPIGAAGGEDGAGAGRRAAGDHRELAADVLGAGLVVGLVGSTVAAALLLAAVVAGAGLVVVLAPLFVVVASRGLCRPTRPCSGSSGRRRPARRLLCWAR